MTNSLFSTNARSFRLNDFLWMRALFLLVLYHLKYNYRDPQVVATSLMKVSHGVYGEVTLDKSKARKAMAGSAATQQPRPRCRSIDVETVIIGYTDKPHYRFVIASDSPSASGRVTPFVPLKKTKRVTRRGALSFVISSLIIEYKKPGSQHPCCESRRRSLEDTERMILGEAHLGTQRR